MNGKTRAILLILLTLIVLGSIGAMIYFVRGFDWLPTMSELLHKPAPTEMPQIETPPPADTPEPTEEPQIEAPPEPAPETAAPAVQDDEDVISSLSGLLATADGQLRYKSELLEDGGQDGEALGHVYSRFGTIRLRFFRTDGSRIQEPIQLSYAGEDLHQEARCADLNGDGSEDLIIRLHTFEDERTVLLFAYNAEKGAYERVHFMQSDALTWSSDFDAASGQIWYRHGTDKLQYDCYELQGMELVLVRRLEDNRRNSADERFSEYIVDGERFLTVQENVPASSIDKSAWSFVNFN